MIFNGSLEELKAALKGLSGEWSQTANGTDRFVAKTKAGMNWALSTGRIWFDGNKDAKLALEQEVSALLASPVAVQQVIEVKSKKVFVVHGHDATARDQLELVLHKLGLDPFVLQNTDGGGLTIIESLEKMIGKNAESSFGIVLMTPDDVGSAKATVEKEADIKPRARQNVVLEMGMLLASLTRERVVILQKGFIETPSDTAGIIYIPFNDHIKEAVPKLATRLNKAGFDIDANKIAHASS